MLTRNMDATTFCSNLRAPEHAFEPHTLADDLEKVADRISIILKRLLLVSISRQNLLQETLFRGMLVQARGRCKK